MSEKAKPLVEVELYQNEGIVDRCKRQIKNISDGIVDRISALYEGFKGLIFGKKKDHHKEEEEDDDVVITTAVLAEQHAHAAGH